VSQASDYERIIALAELDQAFATARDDFDRLIVIGRKFSSRFTDSTMVFGLMVHGISHWLDPVSAVFLAAAVVRILELEGNNA